MNSKVILAPYAAKLRNGNINPKNLPRPAELVALLNHDGYEVVQIGAGDEERIEGVSQFVTNWPWKKLRELIEECATWVSCDSVLPHFCHAERLKAGVVVFAQSDPRIFGHSEHINLLKGREYLRQFQFQDWESTPYRTEAFVGHDKIVDAVHKLAPVLSPNIPLFMAEPLKAMV